MTDLDALLAKIPQLPVADLARLAPQLAACLKACEVHLAMAALSGQPAGPDEYLTPVQVATLLGVNPSYVYRYGRDIPGRIALGKRKIVYSRKQLEAGMGLVAQEKAW